LNNKLLLSVLGGKCKNVDDYGPTRFDVYRFGSANVCNARYNEKLNIPSGVHIIKHDLFKRLKEVFLKVEGHKLFPL
jgi:hypothetical protein